MFKDRFSLYQKLEKDRDSKLIVYVTGDRQGMQTQMAPDAVDKLVEHLDNFRNTKRISLFLHSIGGGTSAGWSIANLIRSFCDEFEVIVATRAHSSGTLLCLGADKIIMTKQATLSPIDPSVNSPLNPQIPNGLGQQGNVPVSVESIKGFIQLATEELKIEGSQNMTQVLNILANNIHPLVLGNVFRARSQIRMLARNLLVKQFDEKEEEKIEKIINFLCSDSGSHDYTINRKEAQNSLGLNIEKPGDDFYKLIMAIYKDIEEELDLRNPFNPKYIIANNSQASYISRRALVESLEGKTDVFISEGNIVKQQIPSPAGIMMGLQDIRTFEGWRKEQ